MAKSSNQTTKPASKAVPKAAPKATPPTPKVGAPAPKAVAATATAASASTTLSVTVSGGKLPFSLQVGFIQDGKKLSVFSFSTSFTHVFDGLVQGSNYDITVGGFNPAGGSAVIALTTDQITLTSVSDTSPINESGASYFVDFNFTVNP